MTPDFSFSVPVLSVLVLNGSAFLWLARTLWKIDARLSALEGRVIAQEKVA